MASPLLIGSGRVWTIKFRAGPRREPVYHAQGMAGAIDWPQGDVTKIEQPSDQSYNDWDIIGEYQASRDRATATLTVYETPDRSELLELARVRCNFDVHVHQGICEDPRDFDLGWQKILVLENGLVTGYSTSDLGAMTGDNQDSATEELPVSARTMFEILRMTYSEVAASEVGEEVVAVSVCDGIKCGDCEGQDPSDGCQSIFALTNSATSSPGVLPQVIITTDQYGDTAVIERWVTAATIGENVDDATCVGNYYVVLSSEGEEYYYASITDLKNESETWQTVSTGIVASSGPTAIWNYSPLISYVSGLAGYIYKLANVADGFTVLDAASVTTEDLHDIDGWDMENVATVGDAGAIAYTQDGSNFSVMTAPSGPTNLYAVAYRNKNELWVGGDDGNLYVTTDFGVNWITKSLPITVSQIDKIVWANETVGFVSARTADPRGKIFRTINGGYSWYVVPENASLAVPTADYFNDMAVCEDEVNKLFIGGLADNGADGILVKGSD